MLFEVKDAASLLGIKMQQVQYWFTKNLLSPYDPGTGRGTKRRLNFQNLVELLIIKKLFDRGVQIDFVLKILQQIKENEPNLFIPLEKKTKTEPVFLCIPTGIMTGKPYRVDIGPKSKIMKNVDLYTRSDRPVIVWNLSETALTVVKKLK